MARGNGQVRLTCLTCGYRAVRSPAVSHMCKGFGCDAVMVALGKRFHRQAARLRIVRSAWEQARRDWLERYAWRSPEQRAAA